MERKTRTAAKTDAPASPAKSEGSAPSANVAKRARKSAPRGAAKSKTAAKVASSRTRATSAAKGTPKGKAKTAAKSAPAKRSTAGPTPERIALATTVAKLRAKGTKWNEIATITGKSEPTLATLRKDVRAGKFANVSPASARIAASADGSGKGSF